MARELQGMWISGLRDIERGLDNPLNQEKTDWFPIENTNLADSFALQQEAQNRNNIVYNQQQERQFQPSADSMSMWGKIYNVLAENISQIGSAFRDKNITDQNASIMRPSILYIDPFGDKSNSQNRAFINSKMYEM